MKRRVTIVDYDVGNLLSVSRAFEHCGAAVTVSSAAADILAADRVVLPGVGAFKDGMHELTQRQLLEPLRAFSQLNRPFLGICLGMQMMLETSEEFGRHEGLGLIPGAVVAIPRADVQGRRKKIPHIGWTPLLLPAGRRTWDATILDSFNPGRISVYFVHSYFARPARASDGLAECEYEGCRMSAAINSGCLYGCQFHPEKSGDAGLQIIRNFIGLN